MIDIGKYQTLTIHRQAPQGLYLINDEEDEVLLPQRYVTSGMNLGDEIEVFAYCDSHDIEVATTERPVFCVDEFACLRVTDVNEMGAFCDWGISKELFVPFRNQKVKLRPGQKAVVYMYVDDLTYRLVGTTKLNRYLSHVSDDHFSLGQEVALLVYAETDLGYKVIINQKFSGLVYKNEAHTLLHLGQALKGYVKPARTDGKIDISLYPLGHKSIEPNAEKILQMLKDQSGFLPFTDKSDPMAIKQKFGISKKLFKKALGGLYRQKLVLLKKDGIYLSPDSNL